MASSFSWDLWMTVNVVWNVFCFPGKAQHTHWGHSNRLDLNQVIWRLFKWSSETDGKPQWNMKCMQQSVWGGLSPTLSVILSFSASLTTPIFLSHPIAGFLYYTHSHAVMKYPISAAVAFSGQPELPQNGRTNSFVKS